MPDKLKAILLIVVSVSVTLGAVEGAVRLFVDNGMQYDIEMWKYARVMKRVSDIPDVGHEHRPNTNARLMGVDVRINSNKQRNPEISLTKPKNTFRILMLGDSLTFGWGVKEAETAARRLEVLLNHERGQGRRVSVINAGVGNYNTAMQTAWMRAEADRFEPDLIVVNYFINDAEETPRRQGGFLREWSAAFVYFWGRLDLLQRQFFGRADWREYYRNLYREDAAGWQATKSNFAKLAAYRRDRGIPLVIVNYPELRQLSPYPFSEISEKIAQLSKSHNLPYLDLLQSVETLEPESLWVSREDAHPNGKAFAYFSKSIAEWIDRWIER